MDSDHVIGLDEGLDRDLPVAFDTALDARGQAHDVIGDGVVGEQPVLEPGEAFEYTSGTPLTTSSGFMSGSFRMISEAGEMFDVSVPAFSLDSYEGPQPFIH